MLISLKVRAFTMLQNKCISFSWQSNFGTNFALINAYWVHVAVLKRPKALPLPTLQNITTVMTFLNMSQDGMGESLKSNEALLSNPFIKGCLLTKWENKTFELNGISWSKT